MQNPHLQPNTTLQGGKYRIERVLGQGGFGKVLIVSLLVMLPVLVMAQASGGQIKRKPQVSRQTHSTRSKTNVDNQELKKYWEERCKNVTSTQLEGEREVVKVSFDNFIYSFGNALLDENKKATLRYMLESIRKEMNNDFHLIIWGYRDPQEPDYISFERAYRVYDELIKQGVKNFQIIEVRSCDTNSGYDISSESGRQKSRTVSIFFTL